MPYVGDQESGFEWLPGQIGQSNFYRVSANTPGAGDSTVYRCDGMLITCDVCKNPRAQWQIGNLTA